jgi:hypothetical protein
MRLARDASNPAPTQSVRAPASLRRTVYNAWFIAIVLGSYAWLYPRRIRRLGPRVVLLLGRAKVVSAVLLALLVGAAASWVVLLASMVREQAPHYVRAYAEDYTTESARGQVNGLRTFTTDLFNPSLDRALKHYMIANEMHNARYVGCVLVPLVLLGVVNRWSRRDRFLIACGAGILAVCLAPPLLLIAWKAIPFMKRVQWVFSWYSHHWQLLVVLWSGAALDLLLRQRYGPALRQRFVYAMGALVGLMLLVFVAFSCLGDHFPARDAGLQGNLVFALLVLLSSILIWQYLLHPGAGTRRLLVLVLLLLAVTDLTRYFWEVSQADKLFTDRALGVPPVLPEAVQARLKRRWSPPDASMGFPGGQNANLPVTDALWPHNRFLYSTGVKAVTPHPALRIRALHGPPLEFFPCAQVLGDPAAAAALLQTSAEEVARTKTLFLQETLWPSRDQALPPAGDPGGVDFAQCRGSTVPCEFRQWTYNTFCLQAHAPANGWLYIRQLYDRCWRVEVDGKRVTPCRANFAGMAVPITPGAHVIQLDYRPLARRWYRPACLLLQGTLAALALVGWWANRRRGGACGHTPTGLPDSGWCRIKEAG